MNENKTNINWFPGHMKKAEREISETIKSVDLIVELRDARAIDSSINPLLKNLAQNKPKVIILSKVDLADQSCVNNYIKENSNDETIILPLNLVASNYKNQVISACLKVMENKHQRLIKKGVKPRASRALVLGIPNVGKSTFINTMRHRKVMATANTPGVTRYLRLVKVSKDLELIDTPGMLWPKFYNEKQAYHLALIGSMNDHVLPLTEIITYGLDFIKKHYPILLEKELLNISDYETLINEIALKSGYLLSEGKIDEKRAQIHILKIMRSLPLCWDLYVG